MVKGDKIWRKKRFSSKNKDFILKQVEFTVLTGESDEKVQQRAVLT